MKASFPPFYLASMAAECYAGLVARQGVAGTTTRYFDCCKNSCSWSNKAPFSAPVNTCDINDKVLSNGKDAPSGCDSNGQAFVCSSQQPYAINDNLAYGFAAVSSSRSESDTCCACYKLSFTSQINGKVMVVQATNIGYDVQSTQFDLALPGGGVGAFPQGCQKQYKAGPSGWGRQYGGVSSRSECAQLPERLQPGCQFRFDWLKGADNPTVSWERVSCPAELVAKTSCRRNDDSKYPAPPTSGGGVTTPPSTGGGNTGGSTGGNTGGNTGGGNSGTGSGSTAARYGQCGGMGYTGPTRCVTGTTCRKQNDYYSQCL
ncbi:Putative Cellulose-binding domain, fungal, glycoside hydrolase, family 45 [Septoria linicola]|uniref:Cellulase n=1 Tax=Septoria linicola TaxID=215465 RepID=A0A9Q9AP99_9PEZI|nr:putative Cellulose-binding domain, fungal, glycoside hydrolase, family 45 [Septoria linicola]USW49596.1 Putative Cellulose-binding domain, fungal, glycoside hydrolase, family 45 [Septoria linicola]